MKRNAVSIEETKNEILLNKGKRVRVSWNKGRKKVARFDAVIAEVYPAVFVLEVDGENKRTLTASYGELICGELKIKPQN